MSELDGGPAFPCERMHTEQGRDEKWRDRWIPEGGMSLRDYFAAHAIHASWSEAVSPQVSNGIVTPEEAAFLATNCYVLADALLKAREPRS